jgi:hypothetical protein
MMRSIIAALMLLFAATQALAEDDPNYVYAITFTDGFAATRYAKPEYIATVRKGRPDCVVVNWAYAPKDEDNIDELKTERDSAESAVLAALNEKSEAIPAAVTVGGFSGVWIFYVGASQELSQALESRLGTLKNSRFRVRVLNDPEWMVYSNYVKRLAREK